LTNLVKTKAKEKDLGKKMEPHHKIFVELQRGEHVHTTVC